MEEEKGENTNRVSSLFLSSFFEPAGLFVNQLDCGPGNVPHEPGGNKINKNRLQNLGYGSSYYGHRRYVENIAMGYCYICLSNIFFFERGNWQKKNK